MAKVFVYDAYTNRLITYTLAESDPMPYSTGTTLRVREFRGSSKSTVLWTTVAAMEAWNLTRRSYGAGIPVGYAFKRIWRGAKHHRRQPAQDLQRRRGHRRLGLCGAAVHDAHLGAL